MNLISQSNLSRGYPESSLFRGANCWNNSERKWFSLKHESYSTNPPPPPQPPSPLYPTCGNVKLTETAEQLQEGCAENWETVLGKQTDHRPRNHSGLLYKASFELLPASLPSNNSSLSSFMFYTFKKAGWSRGNPPRPQPPPPRFAQLNVTPPK